MIKNTFIVLILLILGIEHIYAQSSVSEFSFKVEDFENELLGDLPENWYNQKGEARPITYTGELRETYNYQVMEESGNKFLRFEGIRGKHLNYPLINKDNLNIYSTPVLEWKWRILDIPDGANEDNKSSNDAAASIYVVFDLGKVLFKRVPKSIRYTWSSTLPVGKEMSHFYGNQKIVVIGTGQEGTGEWMTFQRNIVEDYKRLFGDAPPEVPIAILILSDGDSTQQMVKADYDDILLKSSSTN